MCFHINLNLTTWQQEVKKRSVSKSADCRMVRSGAEKATGKNPKAPITLSFAPNLLNAITSAPPFAPASTAVTRYTWSGVPCSVLSALALPMGDSRACPRRNPADGNAGRESALGGWQRCDLRENGASDHMRVPDRTQMRCCRRKMRIYHHRVSTSRICRGVVDHGRKHVLAAAPSPKGAAVFLSPKSPTRERCRRFLASHREGEQEEILGSTSTGFFGNEPTHAAARFYLQDTRS